MTCQWCKNTGYIIGLSHERWKCTECNFHNQRSTNQERTIKDQKSIGQKSVEYPSSSKEDAVQPLINNNTVQPLINNSNWDSDLSKEELIAINDNTKLVNGQDRSSSLYNDEPLKENEYYGFYSYKQHIKNGRAFLYSDGLHSCLVTEVSKYKEYSDYFNDVKFVGKVNKYVEKIDLLNPSKEIKEKFSSFSREELIGLCYTFKKVCEILRNQWKNEE